MYTITTTQLRTQTTRLVNLLQQGEEVSLIHRSRLVGRVMPQKKQPKVFTHRDARRMAELIERLNLPQLSQAEMERNYRDHMAKKYGKYLP